MPLSVTQRLERDVENHNQVGKRFFTDEQITELFREVITSPTDGDGRTIPVDYNEGWTRLTIRKLILDLLAERKQNAEKAEYIATIVNSYHPVLTYGLTQEGIRLVKGPKATDSTE